MLASTALDSRPLTTAPSGLTALLPVMSAVLAKPLDAREAQERHLPTVPGR
jgi:hypothetical protein